MLEQIGDTGLYVMPVPVCDLPPQEVLKGDLDLRHIFHEPDEAVDELVRRLLEFNLEQNSWVGVGWAAIVRRLGQEQALYQHMVRKNQPADQAYLHAMQKYGQRNKWTLGLYRFFQPAPTFAENPELTALRKKVLWSTDERREKLGMATMVLKEQDYLKVELEWLGSEGRTNVFFLTPKLVWKYKNGKKA